MSIMGVNRLSSSTKFSFTVAKKYEKNEILLLLLWKTRGKQGDWNKRVNHVRTNRTGKVKQCGFAS